MKNLFTISICLNSIIIEPMKDFMTNNKSYLSKVDIGWTIFLEEDTSKHLSKYVD